MIEAVFFLLFIHYSYYLLKLSFSCSVLPFSKSLTFLLTVYLLPKWTMQNVNYGKKVMVLYSAWLGPAFARKHLILECISQEENLSSTSALYGRVGLQGTFWNMQDWLFKKQL